MTTTYKDRWLECTDDELVIHGYYFPWGTKRIRYPDIRSVRRVPLDMLRGRGRVWGTANPGYWASFDPGRPRKKAGLVLDVRGSVKPFITPDDPEAVLSAISAHSPSSMVVEDPRGPII